MESQGLNAAQLAYKRGARWQGNVTRRRSRGAGQGPVNRLLAGRWVRGPVRGQPLRVYGAVEPQGGGGTKQMD
jgi:hypothetical protein